jgi:hypothetical protein
LHLYVMMRVPLWTRRARSGASARERCRPIRAQRERMRWRISRAYLRFKEGSDPFHLLEQLTRVGSFLVEPVFYFGHDQAGWNVSFPERTAQFVRMACFGGSPGKHQVFWSKALRYLTFPIHPTPLCRPAANPIGLPLIKTASFPPHRRRRLPHRRDLEQAFSLRHAE